jgi:hypothetical protein
MIQGGEVLVIRGNSELMRKSTRESINGELSLK